MIECSRKHSRGSTWDLLANDSARSKTCWMPQLVAGENLKTLPLSLVHNWKSEYQAGREVAEAAVQGWVKPVVRNVGAYYLWGCARPASEVTIHQHWQLEDQLCCCNTAATQLSPGHTGNRQTKEDQEGKKTAPVLAIFASISALTTAQSTVKLC